jgi:hypothetical protein
MSTQVVAQYPELGFTVLEDDVGQFLQLAEKDQIVPVRDYKKTTVKALLSAFVRHKVAAVERARA